MTVDSKLRQEPNIWRAIRAAQGFAPEVVDDSALVRPAHSKFQTIRTSDEKGHRMDPFRRPAQPFAVSEKGMKAARHIQVQVSILDKPRKQFGTTYKSDRVWVRIDRQGNRQPSNDRSDGPDTETGIPSAKRTGQPQRPWPAAGQTQPRSAMEPDSHRRHIRGAMQLQPGMEPPAAAMEPDFRQRAPRNCSLECNHRRQQAA